MFLFVSKRFYVLFLIFVVVACSSTGTESPDVPCVSDGIISCEICADKTIEFAVFGTEVELWPEGGDIPVWLPPQGGLVTGFNLLFQGVSKRAKAVTTRLFDVDGTLLGEETAPKMKLPCMGDGKRMLVEFMAAYDADTYSIMDLHGRNAIIEVDVLFEEDGEEPYVLQSSYQGVITIVGCELNDEPGIFVGRYGPELEPLAPAKKLVVWDPDGSGITLGFNILFTGTPEIVPSITTRVLDSEGAVLGEITRTDVSVPCTSDGYRAATNWLVPLHADLNVEELHDQDFLLEVTAEFPGSPNGVETLTTSYEGTMHASKCVHSDFPTVSIAFAGSDGVPFVEYDEIPIWPVDGGSVASAVGLVFAGSPLSAESVTVRVSDTDGNVLAEATQTQVAIDCFRRLFPLINQIELDFGSTMDINDLNGMDVIIDAAVVFEAGQPPLTTSFEGELEID
ncbi:MAG: hypothetical protein CMH54_04365 [Myxococcales bacterium]|nr:hypothetical protein [Myxococcales bacterium]